MPKPEPGVEEIAERLLRKLLKRHSTWLGDGFLADGVSAIVSALRARDERAAKIAESHLWGTMTNGAVPESIGKPIARRCQQVAAAIRKGRD